MASSFMGLYVQRDALQVSQKSLDIVGNNISNIETKGYTRQRVDVKSVVNNQSNLMYNTSVGLAGQGVEPVGVAQIRDMILDKKVRTYTSDTMNIGIKVSVLSDIEDALDNIESESAGFNAILSKFKASLQSFSADNANRQEVANIAQSSAKAVVEYLNSYDSRLTVISEQTLDDTKKVATRINSILSEMGSLNKQLTDSYINMNYFDMTFDGFQVQNQYGPLELKDQMNLLMDELSQYCDIDFKEEYNGSYTVSMAGVTVVKDKYYEQIAMINEDDQSNTDPDPLNMGFVITRTCTDENLRMDAAAWKKAGATPELRKDFIINNTAITVDITDDIAGGSLRGYLDAYNGNGYFSAGNNEYQGIEYYRSMLNCMAKSIAEEFNAIFETDFGFKVFTYGDPDGNFDNAAETLRISAEWLKDPILISKPSKFNGGDDTWTELDNTYIQKMLGVFTKEHTYSDGTAKGTVPLKYTLEKFSQNINDELGSQVEYETNILKTNNIMLASVETARDEVMGVSMDEEGVNMLNYQKWYAAIARMINTLDEALDKLINGTGKVGM